MKFNKKLSGKQFILSHIIILIAGLTMITGLYYILNIRYEQPKNLFLKGPVTTSPKTFRLDLDQPDDDSLTFQSSTVVSGKTAPGVFILISTDAGDLVIKSKPDGGFSTVLDLDEGVNKITAVVFDSSGDFRSAGRTVYFSKEKI